MHKTVSALLSAFEPRSEMSMGHLKKCLNLGSNKVADLYAQVVASASPRFVRTFLSRRIEKQVVEDTGSSSSIFDTVYKPGDFSLCQ